MCRARNSNQRIVRIVRAVLTVSRDLAVPTLALVQGWRLMMVAGT